MKIPFSLEHRNKSFQKLNVLFICVFLFFTGIFTAQTRLSQGSNEDRQVKKDQDSLIPVSRNLPNKETTDEEKPKIQEYLIISHENDTTFVDTTLTIQKDYKFNYLRKDNFGLIPFSNLGQTYNTLTYNFENTSLMPEFGARAKHFNYMEIEDINYYRVPTPLTELFFRSAFEQGQLVDSFFTVNTSPQFNFSVAYKGLRSLGKYQHILTSVGNFRVTGNYNSKNGRYTAKGHVVTQDLMNQENGGLPDDSLEDFESGDPEFIERSILKVNFENAESMLLGKRYHLNHAYKILKPNDSVAKNSLDVSHIISYETKYYQYEQSSAQTAIFGDAFNTSNLSDKVTLTTLYNQLQLNYGNNILGNFQFNASLDQYNYGYNRLVTLNGETITNRLIGDVLAVGGKYHKFYRGFELNGDVGVNLSGDFQGNYIKGDASIKLTDDIKASALINHSSKAPNYNALLYQSNYINYNWQNKLNNIETQQIAFKLESEKIANVSIDFSTINNYTYFKEDEITNQVAAFQSNSIINYLRVRLQKEIKVGKFALNATVEYQNVKDTDTVLNVPEFNTRSTLYFSSHLFNKAMFLQTGVTVNYFTKYYMNAYSPVLAEFYVQKERKYGEFPRLDFFINAKIRQTRLYLKAEHFNSSFTGYDYYSSPRNPYRDFIVRFGVVWNFFL
jgi:hypothetical protein